MDKVAGSKFSLQGCQNRVLNLGILGFGSKKGEPQHDAGPKLV